MNMEEVKSLIQFFFILKILTKSSNGLRTCSVYDRETIAKEICLKDKKKKALVVEEEPEVEIITKVEYIYEDNKATTGVKPNYKWGEIYTMIANHNVPNVGFEELTIYTNIEKSALMKVATRPELFPCSKVIGWILPRADVTTMIRENIAKQGYAAYSLAYVSMAYHLPPAQIYLTESWLKETTMDPIKTVKRM